MAWRDQAERSTRAWTSPLSAADDPQYSEMASRALGATGLVHLRWATDGLAVEPRNTHPFLRGNYAFAHNGSIAPIDKLESLLAPERAAALRGDTDSERYFELVMQCIREEGDDARGLLRAVDILRDHFPDASLNALLLTERHLFAVHVNSAATTPLDDLRELFGSEEAMPPGHASGYFDMSYRCSEDAVHIVSSGLAEDGWSPLPQDRILTVDVDTRQVQVLDNS